MDISLVDRNFAIEPTVTKEDIVWHDVKEEAFDIYGLYDPKNTYPFYRLPPEVAAQANSGVHALAYNVAGGRIRFRTDSPYIAVRIVYDSIAQFGHMPRSGTSGIDIYRYEDGTYTYLRTAIPQAGDTEGYERLIYETSSCNDTEYVLNLPLYNSMSALYIGLQKDAHVEHGSSYRDILPVVYYGSSITQGGCASRPGNAYQAYISRRFDVDFVNLGFSGSCRAEPAMSEYIGNLPMSVFVYDYDHNAPSLEYLKETHLRFYLEFRQHQPDTPIIMVSRPNILPEEIPDKRTAVVRETYDYAVAHGDKNVVFIHGYDLFGDDCRDSCTVDGCHPNDLGFFRMAKVIGNALEPYLK